MHEATSTTHTTAAVDVMLLSLALAIDMARAGRMYEDDREFPVGQSWDVELEGIPWADGVLHRFDVGSYAQD